ncbi:hypothetical protein ABTY98_33605 [Streptomyces sp. NPDC096040]|uniref:hypothetical protein n=1 Tax=Streptomyces sp. NPDC096040 TaxID=3155541 RepID=UPI00331A487D
MTTGEPSEHDGHPHLRHLKEQLTEHHRQARAEHEDAELEEAIDTAAFDLGADIAHPAAGHTASGYDVDTDIGVDPHQPAGRTSDSRQADKELP